MTNRCGSIRKRVLIWSDLLAKTAALAAVVGLCCTVGCVYLPADRDYAGPISLPDTLVQSFAYEGGPAEVSREVLETTKQYTVRRVKLESQANVIDSHPVVVDYYDVCIAVSGHGARPAIVVLPILGGGNKIANIFASYFAKRGYAAMIVHRQEGYVDTDDLEGMNLVFRQIVLDHKQALDWLESQPGIDAGQIGLFGVSAGAVKGTLVSALDRRIKASVLALVGGDVPYIFSFSADRGITKRRNKILKQHKISARELYEGMKEGFEHDPLVYAPYIDATNTLMVLAFFDAVIPFSNGKHLRQAIGNPETIVLPTGHYGAILSLPYIEAVAMRFFKKRFEAR